MSKGVKVWIDRDGILPGERWEDAIVGAIRSGAFFVSFFSKNYIQKNRSFVYEELTIAIEELRLRPHDRTWFIPLRLDETAVPDRSIGAGSSLSSLQRLDLFGRGYNERLELLSRSLGRSP